MNPRQRRGALLLVLAAIGAIVVFISVVGYVQSVRAEVGVKVQVLRVKQKGSGSNSSTTTQVVPITFALSAVDSLKLTREESFATKIRLALIGGTSGPDGVLLNPVCQTQSAK